MIQVGEYTVRECLRASKQAQVYRAQRLGDGVQVLIKSYPRETDQTPRARMELAMLNSIAQGAVPKAIEALEIGAWSVLVMEYVAGRDLAEVMSEGPLEIERFLELAIAIASSLAAVHAANVVHRDIKPRNIRLAEDMRVCLVDFGIAVQLGSGTPTRGRELVPQGTPLYVAPEQSARSDVGADYRSDLYSLGATFYEMLLGEPPFREDDPSALIQAHVSRAPVPPSERRPEVPQALSRIVTKLLAKAPAQRYQTASGLLHDLEQCRDQWVRSGSIPAELTLGTRDYFGSLCFPARLYGRDAEVGALEVAYSRVLAGSSELVLVMGPAGSGKSSLLQALRAPVSESSGYFTEAGFHPHCRDFPYAAFRTALSGLAAQLLAEGPEQVAQWKSKFVESLGTIGRVLVDLVPELEPLVGETPAVEKLPPRETSRRLALAVGRLIRVIAKTEHPLVLLLDDLQWADAGSRFLLEELLIGEDIEALLVVGTYREDEVDSLHPLSELLERLRGHQVSFEQLSIGSLRDADTAQLIADTVGQSVSACGWLAEHVSARTGNNPLLVRQFLLYLYYLGLLRFSHEQGWSWDERSVREAQIPDNIVGIMAAKIERLDPGARQLLSLASAIGNSFQVDLLMLLAERARSEIDEGLERLCQEGFIAPKQGGFQFLHDRIREAAYNLQEGEQRARLHRDIGRILLESTRDPEHDERIFEIADHWNRGSSVLRPEERLRVIELDCAAGGRALRSGAPVAAEIYLASARALALESDWQSQPDLMFRLHFETAQVAAASGRIADAERCYEALLAQRLEPLQRGQLIARRVALHSVAGVAHEAIAIGLAGLREFGVRLPASPANWRLWLAVVHASWRLRRYGDDAFERGSGESEPHWQAQLAIMLELGVASVRTGTKLDSLLACRAVVGTLRRGGIEHPAGVVASFAKAQSRIGRLDEGHRLALLATEFAERHRGPGLARIALRTLLVRSWVEPRRRLLEDLRELAGQMLESGDVESALITRVTVAVMQFVTGEPLARAEFAFREVAELSRRSDYQDFADPIGSLRSIARLTGSEVPSAELGLRAPTAGANTVAAMDMGTLYMLGRYAEVLDKAAEVATWFRRSDFNMPFVQEFHLYRALAAGAVFPELGGSPRRRARAQLRHGVRYFRRLARYGPENFEHLTLLLEAEETRLAGEHSQAMLLYARAAELAHARGYQHHAAIAYERRGSLCLELDSPADGRLFLQAASKAYHEWGASLKVQQLQSAYSDLLASEVEATDDKNATIEASMTATLTASGSSTALRDAHTLDFATVLRSSEAISGEVELERVLERVMAIAIENAGAQRAVLLLDYDGELRIEAESSAGHGAPALHGSATLAQSATVLPTHVVQYVQRTRKLVVLGHASVHGLFVEDPYIAARHSKSILCLPIIRQAKLVGVLCLENDLVTNAFTEGRVEVLSLLSSHAAISLDNSRLYRQLTELNRSLEGRVEERTLELRKARDAAEEATRAKSEFLAVMSHEIRTPMNVVIGMAQLVMDMELSPDQHECVQAIHTAGDSLLTVINDILDFSKIEAGRLELECVGFNLVECVEEVGAILAPRAYAKGLEFPIVIEQGVPERICGDPARMKQVIINFVNNAIKFTSRGEVEVRVTALESAGSEALLRIEVRDTGIGIPTDRLDRLFQSFSQVDASTTRKYGGTGLGLAICKRLVEAMGGSVGVSSREGVGSQFWCDVRFELDAHVEPRSAEADAALAGVFATVLVTHERSGSGVGEQLRRLGAAARVAADAECLRTVPPDVPQQTVVALVRHPFPEPWRAALLECPYPIYLMPTLATRAEAEAATRELPGCSGLITWPVKLGQLRAALLRSAGLEAQGTSTRTQLTESERAARSRFRILLAEDYELNQRLAVRLLDRAGYACDVVDTGRKVLERFQSGAYDLLLLDCQMPELDGFDTARAIRRMEGERGEGEHLPIIAMTANAMQGDRERCLAAGMDEYLAKPIRVDALYELLAKYLPEGS